MKVKNLKSVAALFLTLCMALSFCTFAVPAAKATTGAEALLDSVLTDAAKNGFCYLFSGDEQVFDGNRVISGTAQDIARLKASNAGTLIVRYQTTGTGNQVIFAAGKDATSGNYGALLANRPSNYQRVDFPGGMCANLQGTSLNDTWHTFVYSVDATDLAQTAGKTVMSFDGSTSTQFPNYASWYNHNANVNDIQFLNIGGAPSSLANSNNNTNFVGRIACVAFLPEAITQAEASVLSGATWTAPIYSAGNLTITNSADAVELSDNLLASLTGLNEISVVVKYQNTNTGVGSFLSVSDPTAVNNHFHVYQSGNIAGFEYRKNDSPKYSATCTVYDGELNTIAFKAEEGVGYKLFANGVAGTTVTKTGDEYQFLSDMTGLTSAFVGKLNRSNDANSYPFTGTIHSIEVYSTALSDELLLAKTMDTYRVPNYVFYNGDETGSTFFRIPFLLAASNGTLIAGSDANFGSTGDSAENIDAAVRIKPNAVDHEAMDGWYDAVVPDSLHMKDYADEYGYKQKSASFIDGVILEDTVYTDRILLLIDAWAWNGGGFQSLNIDAYGQAHGGAARAVAYGDGFCTINGQKYLLLSSENIKSGNINMNTDRTKFNYAADVYGTPNSDGRYTVYHLNGTPQAYSSTGTQVDDSNLTLGEASEYSLNTNYELYKNGVALTVTQKTDDSTATPVSVPMKVFYEDSDLQVYNTSYIMQIYSDDGGLTWETDKIITGMAKREEARYYIVGPGSGLQIKQGPHAGRLVVPVYYQLATSSSGLTSNAQTEVIYSDDGGVTWQHGQPIPNTLGHESVIVELPGGQLQIFVRNTASSGGKCLTATSLDGGITWTQGVSTFGDHSTGTNCQLSAIALSDSVQSADDGQYYPAVLLSMAYERTRTDGRIYVGLVKPDGTYDDGTQKYRIDWEYKYQVTETSELFAYSCLAELADGRIGMIYEASPTNSWADGLKQMYYSEYDISTLTSSAI